MKTLELFAVTDLESGNCFGLFFTKEEAQIRQTESPNESTVELIVLPVEPEHIKIFKELTKKEKV